MGEPPGLRGCGAAGEIGDWPEAVGLIFCSRMWSPPFPSEPVCSRRWYGTKMRTASTGKRPVGENGGVEVWVAVVDPVGVEPSSGDEAVVFVRIAVGSVWTAEESPGPSPGKETLS